VSDDEQAEMTTIPVDPGFIALMIGASMAKTINEIDAAMVKAGNGGFASNRAFVEEVRPLAQSFLNLVNRFEQLLDELGR
jgi:hypothetical protein